MTAGDLISPRVVVGHSEDRLGDVAAAMKVLGAQHCAVTDRSLGTLVGVVRLADVAGFASAGNRILGDLVSPVQPLAIRTSEPAQSIIELFTRHQISEACVVNERGGYVGLATAESVLMWAIDELKNRDDLLDQTRSRLESASSAKDQFIAALSHELRTPLNPVVLLASEGAANQELPEPIREQFNAIATSALLEASLIDDLLDLTRVSKGTIRLSLQATSIDGLLRRVIAKSEPDSEAKRLIVEYDTNAAKTEIQADVQRLEQALGRILKNAVRFTPAQGHVHVRCRVLREAGLVSITITDNGAGMTPEELRRAFEPFEQGDQNGSSDNVGKMGIGLTLARAIVRLHSGSINATSAGRGHGAAFQIQIPLSSSDMAVEKARLAVASASAPDANGGEILLVEDHEPSRAAMLFMLRSRNLRVTAVGSVADALAAAARQPFSVVISDVGLPDGNGYDLMRTLRERHGLRGIALSGYGSRTDLDRSTEAGFQVHLTKPVDIQRLQDALVAVTSGVER
ncbi:MAG: ATP-binding protein [Opitutus sp.]